MVPGVNINSTYINSSYEMFTGTSMASPYVAEAVALYKERNPSASYAEVRDAIISMASINNKSCNGNARGYFDGDADSIHEPLSYLEGFP